jgi:hypothetical protein
MADESFIVYLPVHKQGDDLRRELDTCPTTATALEGAASDYDRAAEYLRQLADLEREHGGLTFDADTHEIIVTGPRELLEPLDFLTHMPDEEPQP